MDIDLNLYRRSVRVSGDPLVRLSVIDIAPERPRRTFVFIHGFGGQAVQWQYQLQRYALKNRVVALDLRGHGLSDKPPAGYDMPQMQQDLENALRLLRVEAPFVLVGHSFGGALVTEYALRHPQQVERLVLIATAGEFRLNPLFKLGLNLPDPLLRLIAPLTRAWLAAPPHVLKPFYRRNLSRWNGWEKFAALQTPTLVIRGHRDTLFARPLFEQVAQTIPGAEDADIGVSGHMVMLERREAVNRALERFLEGGGGAASRRAATPPRDARAALRAERPWLKHYEAGVPYTVAVPRIPLHHLLRAAVRRYPRRPALRFEGARLSYRALNHEVNRFANALTAMGIGKGARVLLHLPNLPQAVIAFYGTLKAGAVAVLTQPGTDVGELTRQARLVEARALITLTLWARLAEQVQAGSGLPLVVLTDPGAYLPLPKRLASRWRNRGLGLPGAPRFRRWISGYPSRSPTVEVQPEDLAAILFTGGTTSAPKGVMLTHRNLVANALQTRHWMPHAEAGREVALCVLPFSHSYGLTAALNVPIALGASLVLKTQFEIRDILKTIRKHRPTIFPGVPGMYVAINGFRGVRKYGIGSIRACISGSAPLPVEVSEAFEKLTKGRLVEGYGLTEASPITHANPLNGLRKVGSIGIPLPSTEAMIVDLASGRPVDQPGQIGELAVRGPQVMAGYWKDPEATRAALTPEGWLLTGDVAQADEDGYFRIVARKADMWYPDRPGQPAFPRDVEEVIYEIPQVKEVAVVAVANRPVAFVIAGAERPAAEAVIAYCRRRLPPSLVPRLVLFMDDFPRTFIGKVLRRELAKRYGKPSLGQ